MPTLSLALYLSRVRSSELLAVKNDDISTCIFGYEIPNALREEFRFERQLRPQLFETSNRDLCRECDVPNAFVKCIPISAVVTRKLECVSQLFMQRLPRQHFCNVNFKGAGISAGHDS